MKAVAGDMPPFDRERERRLARDTTPLTVFWEHEKQSPSSKTMKSPRMNEKKGTTDFRKTDARSGPLCPTGNRLSAVDQRPALIKHDR